MAPVKSGEAVEGEGTREVGAESEKNFSRYKRDEIKILEVSRKNEKSVDNRGRLEIRESYQRGTR